MRETDGHSEGLKVLAGGYSQQLCEPPLAPYWVEVAVTVDISFQRLIQTKESFYVSFDACP